VAEDFDNSYIEELAKKFNISPEICKQYCKFNDEEIQSRIKKSYLAPLISVVEDLIIKSISENNKSSGIKPDKDDATSTSIRRYVISLYERKVMEYGSTITIKFPHGASIMYDSTPDEKEICISIARELGKLLIEHRIIAGSKEENFADLFANIVLNCSEKKPLTDS